LMKLVVIGKAFTIHQFDGGAFDGGLDLRRSGVTAAIVVGQDAATMADIARFLADDPVALDPLCDHYSGPARSVCRYPGLGFTPTPPGLAPTTRPVAKARPCLVSPEPDPSCRHHNAGLKVQGCWIYLYRAIGRAGALVDVMLSETAGPCDWRSTPRSKLRSADQR